MNLWSLDDVLKPNVFDIHLCIFQEHNCTFFYKFLCRGDIIFQQ
jgi:hypothetical protein